MNERNVWTWIKQRCNNPNFRQWKDYGGRGIQAKFTSFDEFFAEVGERPPGMTIDRINNDGHYEPGNVRWATRAEQQRNRRNPAMVEIRGKKYRVLDLREKSGVRHDIIAARAKRGLSLAEVLSSKRFYNLSGLALGRHAYHGNAGGKASGEKRRQQTHCCHGHEFTPANTYITAEGWRNCRECSRLKMRRRYASQRRK